MTPEAPALLRALFDAALMAAEPGRTIAAHLPDVPPGRTIVLGAGKAAARMAQAFEEVWPTDVTGLVITRYDHAVPCRQIEVVEAAHPVPDAAGEAATRRLIAMAEAAGPDDLVVFLISGGGSALLCAPIDGLTLAEKQKINARLLESGASISEMNAVRKHLSAVKGGRLAAAVHPARLVTMMISDVPGDDPSTIASGPSVPDPTTCETALEILARFDIALPDKITARLAAGTAETPKPGAQVFAEATSVMLATPQMSLEAAAQAALKAGVTPMILSDRIEGEAREVAKVMAAIALQVRRHAQPLAPPCVLLSGGETTVTLRGKGRGGRNVEYLLSLAIALDGAPGIHALACDTDGVDGREEVAGAMIGPDTLKRVAAKGRSARKMLSENDAHSLFEALGDQIITGPTLTNVNDFRAVLITTE